MMLSSSFDMSFRFPIRVAPPALAVELAGDIADCSLVTSTYSFAAETAALISARLAEDGEATILTLGDSVYPNGTPAEFAECYEPTWGRFKARTYPSPPATMITRRRRQPAISAISVRSAGTAGLGYCM
jgi:hypothetical protein